MKKIVLSLALICSIATLKAQGDDKSFKKGTIVIPASINLGVYKTYSKDKVSGETDSDAAASTIYNLSGEYGLLDQLGVGATFQYSNYITEKDSASGNKAKVYSVDAKANVNYHFLRKRRSDLLIGGSIGFSNIKYFANDTENSRAKGSGPWYDLHFQSRFYFTQDFGMFLHLAYAGYGYNSITALNNSLTYKNAFSLKGSGVNLGIGLQYKIN